jgi:hypothetical protein
MEKINVMKMKQNTWETVICLLFSLITVILIIVKY